MRHISRSWNGWRASSAARCASHPPSTSSPVSQRRWPIRRCCEPRIAAGHVAAFQAREAVFGVELPVPVRGKVGERAEARLAFAHRALGVGAAEELADLGADGAERLPQALVRLAHAARRELRAPRPRALRRAPGTGPQRASRSLRPLPCAAIAHPMPRPRSRSARPIARLCRPGRRRAGTRAAAMPR